MKKLTAAVLALLTVFVVFMAPVLAAPPYEGDVAANAVMLLDAATGEVLYEKNADEQIMPASTTKIMTCIVTLENASLDEMVTVGPEGEWTEPGYSKMGLKEGEVLSLKDLLYGLMLASGNDAACAIAVHVGGSLEGFADMMNEKAQELGMTGSHFITPHGVDTDGHYVTARDMATLTLYAMQNETFMEIVGTSSYTVPKTTMADEHVIENTNRLLNKDEDEYYPYATGIKTGYTDDALSCLVSSAENDGMTLACLVFGDPSEHGLDRWRIAQKLFDYGFNNYATVDVQAIVEAAESVSVTVEDAAQDDINGGVLALTKVNIGPPLVTMDKTTVQSIAESGVSASVEYSGGAVPTAPVKKGDVVGTVTYTASDGEVVAQAQLVASRDVMSPVETPTESSAVDEPAEDVLGVPGWMWIAAAAVLIVLVFIVAALARARRRAVRRRAVRRRVGRRNYAMRSRARDRRYRR